MKKMALKLFSMIYLIKEMIRNTKNVASERQPGMNNNMAQNDVKWPKNYFE